MNAIYYFKEGQAIDFNLKSYLNTYAVELEYETRLSNLLTKIIVLRPKILFIDEGMLKDAELFCDLFSKNSPFFIPVVIFWQSTMDKDALPNNFIALTDEDKNLVLPDITKELRSHKDVYLKRSLFPFTKFDEITSLLFKMGFSMKNQGTVFIKDCISYFLCDVGNFSYNLGKVYEVVAGMHGTVPSNIERCIRIAINNVWKDIKPQEVADKIGVDKIFFEHKPTCREIILFVGELILDNAKEVLLHREFPMEKYRIVGIKN